jgi:electron transfer flavoprotein alpha subunit
MSRIRRDPRAERARLLVPGTARPRIDRAGRDHNRDLPPNFIAPTVIAAPRRWVPEPDFLVLAVPDAPGGQLSAHDRQVLGAAQILAGSTSAVVVLAEGDVEDAPEAGADRVLPCAPVSGYDPAGRAQTVLAAMATLNPRHVLFPESTDGGDLARRVAALADVPLFPGIEALSASAATRHVTRPWGAGRFEARAALPRLLSVAPDRITPYSGPPCEARALPPLAPAIGAPFAAYVQPADAAALPLSEAAFVVAAGNGVTDFAMFDRLVHALGATPGASRVLCDAGVMPRARQVGASGTVLQAECYLALGISGAPQHLAGVAGVAHVIAVNTDLHAAMVSRATLAVIADAQAVMEAVLEIL